ncbi:hypothetical protein Taro_015949 [Colocasia esculenta]|uniref:Uncharacterized protein n=1 Tax=Colocasia esculenta TaxID=4460 RepID=A0A843UIX8_COLES|nr:hypothetical protein [Colocasia esculenta]
MGRTPRSKEDDCRAWIHDKHLPLSHCIDLETYREFLAFKARNRVRTRRRDCSAWYRVGLVRRDPVKGVHKVVMRNQRSQMGQGKSDEHPTLRR